MLSDLKLQSPDSVLEVRQGSQELIMFTLLQDVDANKIVDTPIDLSEIIELSFCLMPMANTANIIKFSTLDDNQLISIVSPAGGVCVFAPTATTWKLADMGYYGFVEIKDMLGRLVYVPEAKNFTVVVYP